MSDLERTLQRLISVGSLESTPEEQAVALIGELIDVAYDLKNADGLNHGLKLIEELEARSPASSVKASGMACCSLSVVRDHRRPARRQLTRGTAHPAQQSLDSRRRNDKCPHPWPPHFDAVFGDRG